MIYAIRILMVVILIEVLLGSALLARRYWRTDPHLPAVQLNDPLIMPQLRVLAEEAASGGSADWTRFGQALLGKGFYAHAEEAFREALRLHPNDFSAQFGLAFSLDRTGRTQESSAEYRKLLLFRVRGPDQQLNRAHALYALGRNALREENLVEAEAAFRQVAGHDEADYQLAKLLLRSERANEALPIIDRKLAKLPYSLEFHFLNQRAREQLGQPRAAFEAAGMVERSTRLLALNFNMEYIAPLDAYTGIAAKLQQMGEAANGGDYGQVERLGQEAKSLLGDAPVFVENMIDDHLLEAAVQRKQPERILEVIEGIRKTGREDAMTLEYEGDVFAMRGQVDKAAENWQRALRLTPSERLHRKLAEHLGDQDAALRDRHLGRAELLGGIALYRENQLEQAIPRMLAAARLNPEDPDPWYYLGEIHLHLNKPDDARAAYEHCLQLRPAHGRATAKLAHLAGAGSAELPSQ